MYRSILRGIIKARIYLIRNESLINKISITHFSILRNGLILLIITFINQTNNKRI